MTALHTTALHTTAAGRILGKPSGCSKAAMKSLMRRQEPIALIPGECVADTRLCYARRTVRLTFALRPEL